MDVSEVSETFMYAIMSHKKAKGEISNGDGIAYRENSNSSQESNYKESFQRKPIIRHSTAIMPMDIHKQVIEKISVSKIRKQREAP